MTAQQASIATWLLWRWQYGGGLKDTRIPKQGEK